MVPNLLSDMDLLRDKAQCIAHPHDHSMPHLCLPNSFCTTWSLCCWPRQVVSANRGHATPWASHSLGSAHGFPAHNKLRLWNRLQCSALPKSPRILLRPDQTSSCAEALSMYGHGIHNGRSLSLLLLSRHRCASPSMTASHSDACKQCVAVLPYYILPVHMRFHVWHSMRMIDISVVWMLVARSNGRLPSSQGMIVRC